MFNKILIAGLCLAVSWVQGVQVRMYQNGPSSEALAAAAGLDDKADKVLPYTSLTGANVTVSPSMSYVWETTAGANLLTASGFTEGVDASCSMIITMFEGDTIAASGLSFADELEVGVNHCFIRQMPTGLPQLFVSYAKPMTPEDFDRLEQYGDMDTVPSDASWFVFSDGEITGFNYEAGRERVIIPYEIGGIPVTSIGEWAFTDMDTFEGKPIVSVTAPKTVTEAGSGAFMNCSELTLAIFPSINDVKLATFNGCSKLASVNCTSATLIEQDAFKSCSKLTSISLPLATSVDEDAFYACQALATVSLPLVTSIGANAFIGCAALTAISLPSATSVGSDAFYQCSALTSVSLPMVTSIGKYVFLECTKLTSVSLPMVTSIGDGAFLECTALTSVSLPMVTSIGSDAFLDCFALTSITLGKTPPTWQAGTVDGVTIYVPHDATGYGTTWNGMTVVTLGE